MAGLGLALLAGAAGGVGTAIKENAAASIEDKRQAKRDALAQSMQKDQQTFLSGENAANRASQEKLTQAQLAVQERLGKLSADTTTAVTKLNIGSQEKMTQAQIDARRDEVADQIASGEKIAGMQTDTQKDIAQAQIDAQKDLNIKFVQQADGSQVMMRGKEAVEMPIDPATGKKMVPAITDNDTNEAKNVKYLMTLGVDSKKAMDLVYSSKNADRNLAEAGIFKSIFDGMTTMKNGGEDDIATARKAARQVTDGIYGAEDVAPAAPAAPGTTGPAPPTSADTAAPLTSDQKAATIAAAKKALLPVSQGGGGKSPAAVRAALQKAGITPAEAGL